MNLYPDDLALAEFLLEAKVIHSIPSEIPPSWQHFMDAAIRAFEVDSNWVPFLASSAGTGDGDKRLFDLCGSRFYLPVGLISVLSLTVRGNELTEGEDFYLEPHSTGPPYTWIEFTKSHSAGRRILEITGKWGYSETLPMDVYVALLSRAAHDLQISIAGAGGEVVRVKQDDVDYTFAGASGSGQTQAASWMQTYKNVVARYRRVTF